MRKICCFLVLPVGFVSFALLLPAQRTASIKPTVFAIRDARVVVEPGNVLPRATIIIRDGLIEAVGPDAKAPADALVLDGEGLTVYPGFIDVMSSWGYDPALRRSESGAPAEEDLAAEALAASKPDNRKGMTPEFQVSHALKAAEDQAEKHRKIGFTAHAIAPEGGYFVGQSALVSLSGAAPRETVLRAPVALHAALRGIPGSDYPRSLMGVLAHSRQTLLDAGHYQRQWAAFEKGELPRRPPHDPALAELGLALSRKLPVVFEADSRDEINRALDFAEEFRLRAIVYGGQDAWRVAGRLKEKQVPVLLRLNYLEQPQPRLGRRASGPFYEAAAQDSDRALPPRVLNDHQRQLRDEVRNARVLHEQGVDFAFSTQGIGGDNPAGKFRDNLRKAIGEGLTAESALQALTIDAARILGVDKQLGTIAAGKAAHLVITDGPFHEEKTQVCHVFADGVRFDYAKAKKPDEKKTPDKEKKEEKKRELIPAPRDPDEQATELERDRLPSVRTGGNVLIRGAVLMLPSRQEKADLLIRRGKIEKIGPNLTAPQGVRVIAADGMFVMPGIIDTHSHFAVSGGVNEFSLSIVPEVRVRDVIASDDAQIFRALAGGVTTARLLHGSANCVGGQDAVIKLKYGEPANKLLVADAPRGVKFALGENVKRTDGRFPNTRLGVEAVLIRAFTEAQAYRKSWEDYEKRKATGRPALEPRRDLRLEALVDVLKGDLKVHCHCYRSDEILMLLRVAERFGFRVKSLQHVLEGYKVAPEIARHGASCSTFADWWAYKIEAYDAIPFNNALLHEAGVSVVNKSDSNELMRHLYQEAAKNVKYGGMSESEALKTITLNAARQLGLERRIGALEVGKDGDLAIFNGHPLNSYSRVEMTLVEGEVYFQRSEKLQPAGEAVAGPPATPRVEFKAIPRSTPGTYVLSGVTLHPVVGAVLSPATVFVDKGKIQEIRKGSVLENSKITVNGKEADAVAIEDNGKVSAISVPRGTVVVQAKGLHLYPGMIDAATVLGLTELGSARETHDYAEGGDFQPDLRASTAINPDSELIPVTRANGVTSVVTRPVGSIIAGQSALINLAGWVPREMAVVDPLALHVEFPAAAPLFTGDPTMPSIGRAIAKKQREEKVRRLKELFQLAVADDEARKLNPERPANPRLEALIPYARAQKPVVIQVHRKQEILDALALADELKLKVILSGAIDAWKVSAELKKRDVPVILGPVMTMPQEPYDPFDSPFTCAAKLREAGVRFCIRSAGTSNTRNLPYEAAMAISYGLPPEEGLKAVTLYPAQLMGVADQLGSIETGKRANLVLADGDILQATTQVKALFIDGRPLEPTSKQTRLYDRYRERLREVKEGRAPLGTE